MLRPMRCAGVAIAWGLVAALGCGGQSDVDVSRRGSPEPLGGAQRSDAGVTEDASTPPPRPPGRDLPAPPPFKEPGCPPVGELPDINDCDPLASPSGCPSGQSCFPFVTYPSGPCEVERFGAMCDSAGPGTQGESCSEEACAAEHICVSTGRGTQCVRLCGFAPDVPSVCAPGLLCLPIDIEGFGGCL